MLVHGRSLSKKQLLSRREREVAVLAARGLSSQEIGRVLNVSRRTVDHYVEQGMDKTDASSRTELVVKALALGEITIEDILTQ